MREKEQGTSAAPMISIIVPIYNVEKYLKCCLDSVLAQTFQAWEAVLVDDGSKDACGKICDDYAAMDSRFRVIHKENGGLTSARNAGLSVAQGDWIMHLDGDDWIAPDMLQQMYDRAVSTGADVVIGDLMFSYSNREEQYFAANWDDNKTASMNRYITSVWTCLCSTMAKYSLYEEYHLRSPEGVSYCEDFHLMVRLCYYAKKVVNVHRPFYYYRQREGSLLHNPKKKVEADEQKIYLDIIRFFKKQGVYDDYQKSMCWRMLNVTQELVLERETWDEFRKMVPEKKHYVWDCPWLNRKLKINIWCLTHHLSLISISMLMLRSVRIFVMSKFTNDIN